MKKGWIAGGIVAAAALALILPRILVKQPFAEGMAEPVVEAGTPQERDILLSTGLVGKVEPEDVVYLYPKAAGEVTEVAVKAGDLVEKGQGICVIDTKQIESAKSALDSASLNLTQAKEDFARQSVLYESGDISRQAFEQSQNQVKSAQITYDNAKVNYDNQVSYSYVEAPISGVVEICNIQVFDQVSQGNLLFVISGQGAKVVSFSVTERIRGYMKEGDPITVEKDGQSLNGEITEVSSMADSATGLFVAKARLSTNEEEDSLPTGSLVKLYVVSEKAEQVMAVPVDSVYYDGGLSYVYTYDPDSQSIHKIQVETGLYDEEWMEVKSGISRETQVLTTWSSELNEGTKVRLKERDS